MIARASLSVLAFAALFVACATIDPPASYTKPDGGGQETPKRTSPYDRCRLVDRRFVTNARARVYGDAPGPQAVCVTLDLSVPAAGPAEVVFCIAGLLQNVEVPSVHELSADLASCAYCSYLETNCSAGEAGASPSCTTSYAPVTGRSRVVRFGTKPGDAVWIDVGDLEVARVTYRDATRIDLERLDCIFADGLTMQGVLERASAAACSGVDEPACAIANSAASRFP